MNAVTTRQHAMPPELAHELLARYGSPLYVYDADVLRSTVARIERAVPYARTRFHFASVTNGNLALLLGQLPRPPVQGQAEGVTNQPSGLSAQNRFAPRLPHQQQP
jgi:hypothetical protein